jgi:activator of 2-hydroxyglutaryl-CoA dehydratase
MQAFLGRRLSLVLANKKPFTVRVANNCTSVIPEEKVFIPPPPLPGNLRTVNLKSNFHEESKKLNKEIAFNVFKSASEKKLLESFKQHYDEQVQNLKKLKKEKRKFLDQLVVPAHFAKQEYVREIKHEEEAIKLERDLELTLGLEVH